MSTAKAESTSGLDREVASLRSANQQQEPEPSRDALCPECRRITELGVRRIDATRGRLEMDLTISPEIAVIFAVTASQMLEKASAENYVEMQLQHPDRPAEIITMTVQRWLGKTPHQMRQKAEAERDALLARLTAIEAAAGSVVLAVDPSRSTPDAAVEVIS